MALATDRLGELVELSYMGGADRIPAMNTLLETEGGTGYLVHGSRRPKRRDARCTARLDVTRVDPTDPSFEHTPRRPWPWIRGR